MITDNPNPQHAAKPGHGTATVLGVLAAMILMSIVYGIAYGYPTPPPSELEIYYVADTGCAHPIVGNVTVSGDTKLTNRGEFVAAEYDIERHENLPKGSVTITGFQRLGKQQ